MRYDFVGIREFAEMLTREGGLASGRVLSNRKALEGARLHRHVQKKLTAEHADFQAEKAALYTVNREWLTDSDAAYLSSKSVDIASEPAGFMLEGRIDGVYTDNDTLVICEIKSGDEHPASASAAHFLQAAVYAFIESRDLPSDAKLRIDIIYGLYSDYDALRVFSFAETPESIAAIFRPYAFRYGRYVRFNIDHNARLSRQLDELPFLFDSFRDGQRRLSVNVFNTLNNSEGGTLLCKAPTGIGKTAGTLYPALKALRFADGEKSAVFYFTARGEGARPPAEALKLAGSQATELRYCVLTAKDKICLNTTSGSEKNASREFECKPEQCEAGKGHYDRVDAAIREALFSNARCFDSRFVSELARKHCVCPFELMLDLSQFCDVIVCDYNYLFDPESYLRRYFEGKGGQYFFLIDEAHQLPDRVRSMYSATLDAHTFARLAKGKKRQRIGKSCVKTAQALEALLCAPAPGDTFDEPAQLELFEQGTDPVSKVPARNDAASDGAAADETDSKTTFLVDKSLLRQLESFCDAAAEYLESHDDAEMRLLYFDVLHFSRMHDVSKEGGFTLKLSENNGHKYVELVCIDPARIIRAKCALGKGSVLFSGSLLPEKYYAEQLGFPDAPFVGFESPFPADNLLVLAATAFDTRYKFRADSYGRLAAFIEALGRALTKGNYIVYFSSYSYLESVLTQLSDAFRDECVFVQPRGSDASLRKEFLDGFKDAPDSLHIGFCVLGGNFSEGVDLPGSRLSGTLIVGTGLPQVGDNTELIRSFYEAQTPGSGYNNAYFYPGINKVIQAAGRVIRSETDRGFVLLIDRRYRFADHRAALPSAWRFETYSDEQKIIARIVAFISDF